MSEMKKPKVSISDKFNPLMTGFAKVLEALEAFAPKKRRARRGQLAKARAKRRRQGKVARRARRYNRRPSKRPKGRRKP